MDEKWIPLRESMKSELENILNFWERYAIHSGDDVFYGVVDKNLKPNPLAGKILVLASRLVWTYSSAYRVTQNPKYKALAMRVYDFFISNFIDREYGGTYWELYADGRMKNGQKVVYGEAFSVYALSEYYRAFGDGQALEGAIAIYRCLEKYAYDGEYKGYYEVLTRDWLFDQNKQVSQINPIENACKTMNTHLHLLEAYTALYRVWKDPQLKAKLREHIEVMIDKILNHDNFHFMLYFDRSWNSQSPEISYGHDIEGSWLVWEAAEVLGEEDVKEAVKKVAIQMARAVLEEGWHRDGGILYEKDPHGGVKAFRSWWVQSEAVVGFFNAWQLTGKAEYLDGALKVWDFIQKELVDPVHGGWFPYAVSDGRPANRVDGWTCPYHNARMCVEMMERIDSILHAHEL